MHASINNVNSTVSLGMEFLQDEIKFIPKVNI